MDTRLLSVQRTIDRYNKRHDRTVVDMGHGDTPEGIALSKDALEPLSSYVEERINLLSSLPESNEEKQFLRVVRNLSPRVIALATVNAALHSVALGELWADTCDALGLAIKSECWAAGLLAHDPLLKERIEKAVRIRHGNLSYRRQAARSIAARAGYKGARWSKPLVLKAGTILLRYLVNALPEMFVIDEDLDEYGGTERWLRITPGALKRAQEATEQALRHSHAMLPMTRPPKPWTAWFEGGDWDEHARFRHSVVRTRYKETAGAIRAALSAGAMQPHLDAVNALQAVAWTINERVLGIVRWAYENNIEVKGLPPLADVPMPPKQGAWEKLDEDAKRLWRYRASQVKKRNRTYDSNRVLMVQDLETADLMAEAGRFWCPLNCDWRGRIYSIPHFNFARDDRVRALFLFADGEPIGEEGLKWLKVHVANCGDFDKVSKASIEERIKWTEQSFSQIEQVAAVPTKELWWTKADKPFLFLAACMELVSALRSGPTFVTRLPVSFDGSCSGLQHLAAMTRDEKTAALVNLLPSEKPQDVYQTVADSVLARVEEDASGASTTASIAKLCLAYMLHADRRKLVKRNVMTYSYSSKKFGMAQQLMEDLMRPLGFDVLAGKLPSHPFVSEADWVRDPKSGKLRHRGEGSAAAKYLAGVTYDCIERLVEKPAQAMKMLQQCARALAHEGKPLTWTTPLGLPWINRYHEPRTEVIDLWLHDARVQMKYADGHEPEIAKDRASNGCSPNFVHACDAVHLLMVANASICEDITQLATVHDSFGCLASRAGRFRQIIREQFVRLYEENDVLFQVLQQAKHDLTIHNLQRLPEAPPSYRELELRRTLNADYSFA